jgi:hypothetical protein
MTSNETVSAVRSFLESYRDAFERLDAAAIADHYAYPSHITGDADESLCCSFRTGRIAWRLSKRLSQCIVNSKHHPAPFVICRSSNSRHG